MPNFVIYHIIDDMKFPFKTNKPVCVASSLILLTLFTSCLDKKTELPEKWKPKEPVNLIVAYKPGTGTDGTSRILAKYADRYVGEPVIVVNKEGASGTIGWTELAKSKPDGLTLGIINLPTFCSNILNGLGTYTLDSVVPVANHVIETSVVVVSASSRFNTLQELVDYAKANPKKLTASTNGFKASNHIGAELLADSADFQYTVLPFSGVANQLLAVRHGTADFAVVKPSDFAAFISEIKILAVFGNARVSKFPEVPTLAELGFYPEWFGSARCIVAPKGTPQEAIDFYTEAFRKTMEDPDYRSASSVSLMTTKYMNPEETGSLIKQQYDFCNKSFSEIFK